jgi:hypothetical protein
LHVTTKIDQEISTGDEVNFRKWRITQEIVWREDYCVAQFLPHLVAAVVLHEESLKSFSTDVDGNLTREESLSGLHQRFFVQIGGKDLNSR